MSANLHVIEHRWGTRVTLEAPAELLAEDRGWIEGVISNASLSGAFVRTQVRLPMLSCVFVHVFAGPGEWLEACVVRHDADGMGLEWLDPGLRAVSTLLSLHRDFGGSPQGAYPAFPAAAGA